MVKKILLQLVHSLAQNRATFTGSIRTFAVYKVLIKHRNHSLTVNETGNSGHSPKGDYFNEPRPPRKLVVT